MKFSLIILSGLLMGISQQPIGTGWLAWFCLIPLIKFLDDSSCFKEKFYISILWGFTYHSSVIYWIVFNIGTTKLLGFASLVLSSFILTINTILIVSLYHMISKNKLKSVL